MTHTGTSADQPDPQPPAEPAPPQDEGAVVVDPSWFDKITYKRNRGRYVFVPKSVLGDSDH